MATLMICPTCGGVKTTATGAAVGRRCSCSTGGAAVATATATVGGTVGATVGGGSTGGGTSIAMKVCSVCGADVTDKKRMKDSATGRYWCYDCYVAEQRKKTNGMTMRCAHCKKDFPPVKMMKHGEAYWCEACHESAHGKKKKTGTPAPAAPTGGIVEVARKPMRDAEDEGNGKKSLLVVVAALVVIAAAAYYYFYMMPVAQ